MRRLDAADPFACRTTSPDPPPPTTALASGVTSTLFWIVARFLFFLPALAPIGAFVFACFWFASGLLFGIGTISSAWLGFLAAILALDCLPKGTLAAGPFGLVRPTPPNLTPAGAATELALSLLLTLYTMYAAIFWAFALTLGCILCRLFLF